MFMDGDIFLLIITNVSMMIGKGFFNLFIVFNSKVEVRKIAENNISQICSAFV